MRDTIYSFLKVAFVLAIIPIIAATTVAFQRELLLMKSEYRDYFLNGMVIYAFMHFFLYDCQALYALGQRVLAEIFKLLPPLDKLAPYFVPIYSIIIILFYFFWVVFLKIGLSSGYYFGLLGFTVAMHLVMTAQEFYDSDKRVWKPNYFFSFSLSYIFTIFLIVFALHLAAKSITFSHFFKALCRLTDNSYEEVFRFFWSAFR